MNDQERIEYFMTEIARLSNQVVDLQNERDDLEARLEAIAKDRDDWKRAMARAASVLLLHKVPTKNIDVDKALAQIRAEAVEAFCKSLDGLAIEQTPTTDDCSEDMVIGWKAGNVDCRMAGMKYAAKVRQGGE